MSQSRKREKGIDIRKISLFAVIVNVLELFMLIAVVAYMVLMDGDAAGRDMVRILAIISALMAGWGAVLDIQQGLMARRRVRAIVGLEQTNQMMDELNYRLRAQRHDFLNHLQVVYSLMEMQEYVDAGEYLEKVYGEIRAVSAVLRTKSTAVNALLQVKTAACQDAGIAFVINITSALEDVPIPAWELCCVLSNLLDNAMDAAQSMKNPRVLLEISENLREFVLAVSNPSPPIPEHIRERIFEPGVTTKGEGHGMGLKIVRQTLFQYGSEIACHSDGEEIRFVVRIPKQAAQE